jgi:hypothetical protein
MPITKSKTVRKAPGQACHLCGKESDSYFCSACADKLRAEAVAKKGWKGLIRTLNDSMNQQERLPYKSRPRSSLG